MKKLQWRRGNSGSGKMHTYPPIVLMKNAIIIHGMPSEEQYVAAGRRAADDHWIPWIKERLEREGIETHAPEMPEPYKPVYERWSGVFEALPIGPDTILIGHSCGGGFLVRWLSENKVAVGQVVLVAPWVDPTKKFAPDFFDFSIDTHLASRTKAITLFISEDDDRDELITCEILATHIEGLVVKRFTDYGHFTLGGMGTNEFPELLEHILQDSEGRPR